MALAINRDTKHFWQAQGAEILAERLAEIEREYATVRERIEDCYRKNMRGETLRHWSDRAARCKSDLAAGNRYLTEMLGAG